MAQKRFSLRFLFSRPQQVTIFRVRRSTICICNLLVFCFFLSGCFCWKCELLPQTGAQRAATSPTTSTQYPPKRLGKLLCSNLSPSLQTRLYKYMNSFFAFSFTSCSQRCLRPQLSRSLNCICLLFFFFPSQTSVIKGTYLALEHMSKEHGKQGGTIINVSSMAGNIL